METFLNICYAAVVGSLAFVIISMCVALVACGVWAIIESLKR